MPPESLGLALAEARGDVRRFALGSRAMLLGNVARERAPELVAAIGEIAAISPFRHMITPGGDRNEHDFDHPIVWVSLGPPAIFLWGGQVRSDKARRVPLTHGDVVVWRRRIARRSMASILWPKRSIADRRRPLQPHLQEGALISRPGTRSMIHRCIKGRIRCMRGFKEHGAAD